MKFRNYFHAGAILILALGAITRLILFFQNHSIYLDEANLARNIIEKPFALFFQPLDYEQYAPPLFLVIEKMNVLLLGASEYGLRLFPLLASLFSIYLFYKLLIRYLTDGFPLLFALFIFAFGEYYLHYAVEGKQYASDILLVLLLLLMVLNEKNVFNWQKALKWAFIGMLAIWLSMPSVFILSGVGLFLGVKILETKDYKRLWLLLFSISVWLLNFGIYYVQILSTDVEVEGLQSFHQDFFLPLWPTSATDFQQILNIFTSIVETSVGHTAIAALVGILGIVLGIYLFIKKHWQLAILFFFPIVATLVVSSLHLYSLVPRLTLFFIPILLLTIAFGLQFLFEKARLWQKTILVILMFLTASLHTGISYVWQPFEIEDTRAAMDYIENNKQANDYIYVSHEAWPTFYFYQNLYKNKERYHFSHFVKGDWRFQPKLEDFKATNRIWLLHSHLLSEISQQQKNKELRVLEPRFKKGQEELFTGVSVVLMKKILK